MRALLVLAVLACASGPSLAQETSPLTFELRLDGLAGGRDSPAAVHGGVGIGRRMSTYARLALIAGAGPSEDGLSGRAEAAARFHLDPFRQRRWGPYGGAGAGVFWGDSTEPFLLILLGVEGPRRGGWAPAVEVGLSRGVRLGVALRRTPSDRR